MKKKCRGNLLSAGPVWRWCVWEGGIFAQNFNVLISEESKGESKGHCATGARLQKITFLLNHLVCLSRGDVKNEAVGSRKK